MDINDQQLNKQYPNQFLELYQIGANFKKEGLKMLLNGWA